MPPTPDESRKLTPARSKQTSLRLAASSSNVDFISAIAAAVLDGHAVPVAALSITLLQPALPATPQAEHLIDAVRNAAAELSHRLNYRAQPLVAPMAGDRAARSHANGRSALGDTLIHRA